MAEWISVKERLPESDSWVLVFIKGKRTAGIIETDRYYDGEFAFSEGKVTYWMPLPEPPKGE